MDGRRQDKGRKKDKTRRLTQQKHVIDVWQAWRGILVNHFTRKAGKKEEQYDQSIKVLSSLRVSFRELNHYYKFRPPPTDAVEKGHMRKP